MLPGHFVPIASIQGERLEAYVTTAHDKREASHEVDLVVITTPCRIHGVIQASCLKWSSAISYRSRPFKATGWKPVLRLQMKNFWLVKQEPSAYSWSDFVADGKTAWTGVRNYTARNNLRKMRKGDEVFFYHSVEDKAVVGIARVVREAYPDPTAKEGDWSAVDLAPLKPVRQPVTLEKIKADRRLKNIALVRQGRLSVMPLSAAEFRLILKMGAG